MSKIFKIFLNSIPILLMVSLIPLIKNDFYLASIYFLITLIALTIKKERSDLLVFMFGFFIMIVFEYLFISTGVETFNRNSLFGIMPVWLPFLWAYGFVAIKRSVEILNTKLI